MIVDAFVVVVVGGMGSVPGAYLAALLIGELTAFGIWAFPQITLVLTFLVMAVVLVVRPHGLLGRPEVALASAARAVAPPLRPLERRGRLAWLGLVLALLLAPLLIGSYVQYLLIEIFCLALFAQSLQFLMGPGGMTSFGHAAYFGLGAYGAGLLVKHLAAPMIPALLAAPVAAGLGALLFGWFCVRLAGVYLAMLSLAFAQIVYAIAFQWSDLTGGDNGLVGIWPSAWASSTVVFYYFTLAINIIALISLGIIVFAPFGLTLRAGRDAPLRAEAIGIDVRTHRWLAFALAGSFAGLAGGLLAFLKGTIDPGWLAIPQSVDGLVMVLLGGVETLAGPLVGAAVYHGLAIGFATLTRYWPLIVGLIIVALVLAFPNGIVGYLQRRRAAAGTAG